MDFAFITKADGDLAVNKLALIFKKRSNAVAAAMSGLEWWALACKGTSSDVAVAVHQSEKSLLRL